MPNTIEMRFALTAHAKTELVRRQIPESSLNEVLERPEQRVPAHGGLTAYQSRVDFGAGHVMLPRAIVDDRVNPARVVTVYRTSKIEKYWSA